MQLRRDPDHRSRLRSQNSPSKVASQSPLPAQRPALNAAAQTPTKLSATISQSSASPLIWIMQARQRPWLLFALLSIATLVCYWPCLNGDFVWDDDAWTLHLEKLLRDFSGLKAIWTNLTALQQYYPLDRKSV